MQIFRWDTPVSDVRELYFFRLVERGESWFEVKSREEELFQLCLSGCGPYLIIDEVYLNAYFSLQSDAIGRTFTVEPSPLKAALPGLWEPERFTHYVVNTMDTCIELLAEEEPIIRKV